MTHSGLLTRVLEYALIIEIFEYVCDPQSLRHAGKSLSRNILNTVCKEWAQVVASITESMSLPLSALHTLSNSRLTWSCQMNRLKSISIIVPRQHFQSYHHSPGQIMHLSDIFSSLHRRYPIYSQISGILHSKARCTFHRSIPKHGCLCANVDLRHEKTSPTIFHQLLRFIKGFCDPYTTHQRYVHICRVVVSDMPSLSDREMGILLTELPQLHHLDARRCRQLEGPLDTLHEALERSQPFMRVLLDGCYMVNEQKLQSYSSVASVDLLDISFVVGNPVEVVILNGRHAGQWVSARIVDIIDSNNGFDNYKTYHIYVHRTRRFDNAIGFSGSTAYNIARKHLRSVSPREKVKLVPFICPMNSCD